MEKLEHYIAWFGDMHAERWFAYKSGVVIYPDKSDLVLAELVTEGCRPWGAVQPICTEASLGEKPPPLRLKEARDAVLKGRC